MGVAERGSVAGEGNPDDELGDPEELSWSKRFCPLLLSGYQFGDDAIGGQSDETTTQRDAASTVPPSITLSTSRRHSRLLFTLQNAGASRITFLHLRRRTGQFSLPFMTSYAQVTQAKLQYPAKDFRKKIVNI
ncbi:hypothetical protein M404DRAFT_28680 [Pisolithus tinctorius Marx 270]|uniref:Uncharacterized protein n=1 Tax=Pisolithus tinctorius Marx 270 TaxID=870435 RepID=A0A0C3JVC1_PISTI|nr:hypothetical protein M404DRAFT_28680 [Pisolithus tinctorius Marx 270]